MASSSSLSSASTTPIPPLRLLSEEDVTTSKTPLPPQHLNREEMLPLHLYRHGGCLEKKRLVGRGWCHQRQKVGKRLIPPTRMRVPQTAQVLCREIQGCSIEEKLRFRKQGQLQTAERPQQLKEVVVLAGSRLEAQRDAMWLDQKSGRLSLSLGLLLPFSDVFVGSERHCRWILDDLLMYLKH